MEDNSDGELDEFDEAVSKPVEYTEMQGAISADSQSEESDNEEDADDDNIDEDEKLAALDRLEKEQEQMLLESSNDSQNAEVESKNIIVSTSIVPEEATNTEGLENHNSMDSQNDVEKSSAMELEDETQSVSVEKQQKPKAHKAANYMKILAKDMKQSYVISVIYRLKILLIFYIRHHLIFQHF